MPLGQARSSALHYVVAGASSLPDALRGPTPRGLRAAVGELDDRRAVGRGVRAVLRVELAEVSKGWRAFVMALEAKERSGVGRAAVHHAPARSTSRPASRSSASAVSTYSMEQFTTV